MAQRSRRSLVLPRKKHSIRSVPAPVGGLNVRDAIGGMPSTDAIVLTNWIAQQFGVRCRKGWRERVVGLNSPCLSILSYVPNQENTSSSQLFAVTDNGIYNASDSTNHPAQLFPLSGGARVGVMSSIMYSNVAGKFLLAASNAGGYFIYDGDNWSSILSGGSPGKIDGIDPSQIVFVTSWKRRVWFVERDSSSAWYLPTDQITGTAVELELGPFAKNGGKLSFIVDWTIDAGEGIDDLIAFVFEGGDVLIYKGTNPDNAATFSMVGSYFVGAVPPGRRCYTSYGGDVLIISELGLQPLSYVTRGSQSILRTQSIDYLAKIQPQIAELVTLYAGQNGWDITYFPKENLLILHVPVGPTGEYIQYALYTNTSTWSLFTGLPMICANASNNQFVFGTLDGRVCDGFTGFFDAVAYGTSVGTAIPGIVQPSFSYFGLSGNKQFHMLRPTFRAIDRPGVAIAIITDFNSPSMVGAPVSAVSTGAVWDTAIWDDATWQGSTNMYQDWYSVEGIGYVGTAYIVTACLGDTLLASLDYLFEPGGVL
jgi:hypothetical protein